MYFIKAATVDEFEEISHKVIKLIGRPVVGEHVLDCGKAVGGSRTEALEKVDLGVHHGKICTEFWHGDILPG